MSKTFHVLKLTPEVRGPDGAVVLQAFATRNLHSRVTLDELARVLEAGFETYAMELSINGQLIAKVEVVK